jgi:DNA polymerase elongation subunit (family B)
VKLLNISNENRLITLFCREDNGKQVIYPIDSYFPYFYNYDERGQLIAYDGKRVKRINCKNPSDIYKMKKDDSPESDVIYFKRFLIDRVPVIEKTTIKYFFLDTEMLTKELPDPRFPIQPVSCMSIYNSLYEKVQTWYILDYPGTLEQQERQLFQDAIKYIKSEAPDLILIWNRDFDYDYLYNRYDKLFNPDVDTSNKYHMTRNDFATAISPIMRNRSGHREAETMYPAGISIVDYLEWYRKVYKTLMSYALDDVAQEELGEVSWGKTDFSVLSPDIKAKNINDVLRMAKIEKKRQLIPYYDETRRMSKSVWEDLHWNCLDEQTEILTKNGWRNRLTISKTDEVLSFNLFSKEYEYTPIIAKMESFYKGNMINYEQGRVNFCVTPNHKFPMIFTRNEGKYTGTEEICFEYANSIPTQRRRFILGSMGYKGGKNNYFKDEEIKLCAWIITEGHFLPGSTREFGGGIYIYQSIKNEEKQNEIEKILKSLDIPYKKKIDRFFIPSAYATKYRILLNNKKQIPELFFELPNHQMKLFLSEAIKGDGHKDEFSPSAYICTSDKILVEQYQRLSVLAGYNAYIRQEDATECMHKKLLKPTITYYACIYIGDNYTIEHSPKWRKELFYNGIVWCIQTSFQNFIIRRAGKVMVSGNSKIIDQLILSEAKLQNIVLPKKKYGMDIPEGDAETFEGAYRRAEPGRYKSTEELKLWKVDLASAYPQAIIDFCLDTSNIANETNACGLGIAINGNIFLQNPNALLPSVARKLLIRKADLKKQLSLVDPESKEGKDLQTKYDAAKGLVNSLFGVTGLKIFRLFDIRVAGAIPFLIRDVLHYVEDNNGLKVVYTDTDSLFILSKENPTDKLNLLVQQWVKEKYGKDSTNIEFECEGYFEKILIITMCRYKGWLRKMNGKLKVEIKGIESKRKDSSTYMKKFQTTLIDKVVNEEPYNSTLAWIKQEMEAIKKQPIENIAFPCKIAAGKEYVNEPIFVRALKYAQELAPLFKKYSGDVFFWLYVKPFGTETRMAMRTHKGVRAQEEIKKEKDVIAFDLDNKQHVPEIDWDKMIERNILNKVENIFEALQWDMTSLLPQTISKKELNKAIKEITQEDILEELKRRGVVK